MYHWDGTNWLSVSVPTVTGSIDARLYGVTAISPNNVWAVGYSSNPGYGQQTYIVHWDGTVWSIVPSPSPSQTDADILYSISAVNDHEIYSVGATRGPLSAQYNSSLILKYDGTQWMQVDSSNVSNPANSELYSIAVTTPGSNQSKIWAVGIYTTSNIPYTLTEHYVKDIIPTPTPTPTPTLTPTPTPPQINLNVPLFKQGLYPYNDNNPVWEGDEYDDSSKQPTWCGKTMAGCGCATTSIAMILNYYGVKNPSDGQDTTPATVNNYFKLDGKPAKCKDGDTWYDGWQSKGYYCADVNWKATAQYSKDSFDANKSTKKIDLLNGGAYWL
jgi:hypothetical protein